jgi:hypothetical protein
MPYIMIWLVCILIKIFRILLGLGSAVPEELRGEGPWYLKG